jgi:diacylglycerol kinase
MFPSLPVIDRMDHLTERSALTFAAREPAATRPARTLRILVVSDAWSPQINGVVITLRNTIREIERLGHTVGTITPDGFATIPCPTYPEIRLSLFPGRRVARLIDAFAPEAVHIATEGPLGLAARRHCLRTQRPFTTAYHTQFPEYVYARTRLPVDFMYRWMRWFHAPAKALMVATPDIRRRLAERGFANLAMWSRGVDAELFHPGERDALAADRPIFLYVGRVAVEKNIEAFLALDLPGTKWVVGDGPARHELERRFANARFFGTKTGEELAWHYRQADVFVFPSRTDTFGLVMLEAMASGTPVAAFPVTGPVDVVKPGVSGVLDDDLQVAALAALDLPRDAVRAHALASSWASATMQFLGNLHPLRVRIEPPESPHKGQRGIRRLFNAFFYSLSGLKLAFRHESAFRQEIALAAVLVPIACALSVGPVERVLLIASVLLVLVVELLNSSVEAAIDRIGLDTHRLSKRAKDLGSAAVLIALLVLAMVWVELAGPELLRLFGLLMPR